MPHLYYVCKFDLCLSEDKIECVKFIGWLFLCRFMCYNCHPERLVPGHRAM
jgi:hypothetical protein